MNNKKLELLDKLKKIYIEECKLVKKIVYPSSSYFSGIINSEPISINIPDNYEICIVRDIKNLSWACEILYKGKKIGNDYSINKRTEYSFEDYIEEINLLKGDIINNFNNGSFKKLTNNKN